MPVADAVPAGSEAATDPIGAFGRQYGSTAADVVPHVHAVADGLAAHGVTPTLQHFPGLGPVDANTDEVAGVTDPVTTAVSEQVAAFGELARSDAEPFVMVSSATYPRLNPDAPATFSRQVITTASSSPTTSTWRWSTRSSPAPRPTPGSPPPSTPPCAPP
ncbi:Glycosyl hydrolase family 3 N terminal domain-containing protein [Geodermatophilus amargosae]|uniref:beta-N-acetylhexosaminidase n=1 Tax=Geodermatophilus amargosae TaxID=1296565 RepID=A0A1I6X6U6_9ACTN|nr:Glycosyl hydrolase family 3 N terminal domain-containing protein [Geodermatophilus amargosae]